MKRQLLTIGSLWVCSLLFAHPCSSGQEMQWIDHVEMYTSKRPPVEKRLFRSEVVERVIEETVTLLKNEKLKWMFANCFPNTLDTTVFYESEPEDDTFVVTGDIPAMWLRDSSAQVWPYLMYANEDERLRKMIRGVILRQFRLVLLDPYANAFYRDLSGKGEWQNDRTPMRGGIHERKWEIDSLCYVVRLAYHYWKVTGDDSVFTAEWMQVLESILTVFKDQQRKENRGNYSFLRVTDRQYDTLSNDGYGNPVRANGLIASSFRPSDDATVYPFLIPSNFFAVTSLRQMEEILLKVNKNKAMARACNVLYMEVGEALKKHAIHKHPTYGKIYAFEVDGYGNQLCMDDANIPSLLALPYICDVKPSDRIYQNTRKYLLSLDNPYFFKGKYAEGIGGPHIGMDMVWPMSIIIRAMTSENDEEIKLCVAMLLATDANTGFMHESFHKDQPEKFTRSWFAWQNSLFGELVLKIIRDGKLHLLNEL